MEAVQTRMNDCPKSDYMIRGRDSPWGNICYFHIIWILHLPSCHVSSWLRSQMDFISILSENPALNTNLFPLMNSSFPSSTSPSKNPIPRMGLRALTAGITSRGWFTWSCFYPSVCFSVIFMSVGLLGGGPSARNSSVLMAVWYTVTLAVTQLSYWIAAVIPPWLSCSWGWGVCVLV